MSAYSDHARRAGKGVVQCAGKEPFETQQMAVRVVRRQNRKKGVGGAGVSEYRCGQCGHWHVGSNSRSTSRSLRHAFTERRAAARLEALEGQE